MRIMPKRIIKRHPFLSIIVPVFNESDKINHLIDHIKDIMKNNSYEVIVVDAEKNKGTINKIKDKSIIKMSSAKGRAVQMNLGAKKAKGEILLFLHADTFLPKKAYSLIKNKFENNLYVAGAFNLGLNNSRFIFRVIEKIVKVRTKISRIPFGDQAIFIRKDYFNQIGKYKEIPFLEDIDLMKKINKNKKKICIISQKVLSSTRKWDTEGIFCRTVKNTIIQVLFFLGVSAKRLVKLYYKD
jgi:rSAM/selenodomain-associated transferase 2